MRLTIETSIKAEARYCFDAARDLDLHVKSLARTGERAVAGRRSGLIGLGEHVVWRARHFGITQHFTSKITAMDAPVYFQDSMQRGAFRSFVHDHFFISCDGTTMMKDVVEFSAPFGFLGRIVEKLVLRRYLEQLLTSRAQVIKAAAEAEAAVSPTTTA